MKQLRISRLLAVFILALTILVQCDPRLSARSQQQWQPPASMLQKTEGRATMKVNPKDGLTYIWIPAGTFTMGCSQ